MKKAIKKWVLATLATVMTAMLLTGCQTSSDDKGEKTKEPKEPIVISTTGQHAFFSETNEETGEL